MPELPVHSPCPVPDQPLMGPRSPRSAILTLDKQTLQWTDSNAARASRDVCRNRRAEGWREPEGPSHHRIPDRCQVSGRRPRSEHTARSPGPETEASAGLQSVKRVSIYWTGSGL